MPRTYGGGKFKRAAEGDAVVVSGFDQLQRALSHIDSGTEKEMRTRIRHIGDHVKTVARGNVQHKTGRHAGPRIADSLRVSVTRRGASVYTTAPQGGAQNAGGQVGRNRATLLKRADVSQYMNRAVTASQPYVEQETRAVVNWVLSTFERGR